MDVWPVGPSAAGGEGTEEEEPLYRLSLSFQALEELREGDGPVRPASRAHRRKR